MSAVVLFDGYVEGDAALDNSHWIAGRTREKLGDQALTLLGPAATRAGLASALHAPSVRGLSLFGHGDAGKLHVALRSQHKSGDAVREASEAGAVYGSDGSPALDVDNLHLLQKRWCHAIACNVGLSLADWAIERGAECFIAYATSLTPEFDAGALPPRLAEQLAALTTKTTLNLFEGVRDEATLKESVQTAIDDLNEWFEGNEGEAWADQQPSYIEIAGLIGFAQQLKREMVVRSAVNERSR